MLDQDGLPAFFEAVQRMEAGFSELPAYKKRGGLERLGRRLNATARAAARQYPYFHPLYAGQMLKPPHPVARLAYALAMWIKPEQSRADGGRASSAMGKEAVAEIAGMFGWKNFSAGHLCAAERWRIFGPYGWRAQIATGKENSSQRTGSLYARAKSGVFCNCRRNGAVQCERPHGRECAGEDEWARRRGDRCRDDGNGTVGGSSAGNSRVACKTWIQIHA